MQKWKVPDNFGEEISIGGATFRVSDDEDHGRVLVIETEGDYSVLSSFGCEMVAHEVTSDGELEDWLKPQTEGAETPEGDDADDSSDDSTDEDDTSDESEDDSSEDSDESDENNSDESDAEESADESNMTEKKAARRKARKARKG
jgi:hypothetical protein